MKNLKGLLFAGLLCAVNSISAQSPSLGAKAGLNYAGITGYEGDRLVSFHAGFFVHTVLDKQWRIQPELLYSKEGTHYVTDGVKNTIVLGYVALPVAVQYFPSTSFYLEAGPQLCVLVCARSKRSGEPEQNIKRSFANGQADVVFGAGVFLKKNISLYGRYQIGLTDMTPHDTDADHSRLGQIGISIRFK